MKEMSRKEAINLAENLGVEADVYHCAKLHEKGNAWEVVIPLRASCKEIAILLSDQRKGALTFHALKLPAGFLVARCKDFSLRKHKGQWQFDLKLSARPGAKFKNMRGKGKGVVFSAFLAKAEK